MKKIKSNKLILIIIIIIFATGCMESKTKKIENQSELNNQNQDKYITNERIKELYPGWILLKKELLSLNGSDLIVVGLIRQKNEYSANVRFTVCKFVDNQWVEVWRVPNDLETEFFVKTPITEDNLYIKDLMSIGYDDSALVFANVLVGGNHGITQIIAFTANNKNEYALKLFDSHGFMTAKKEDNYILIEGSAEYGTHKIYLENGEFKEDIITRSNMAAKNTVRAEFVLNPSNKIIYPSQSSSLTVKVGQTISFIPVNNVTKQAFDNGEIEIYTNAWNEGPLNICEANKISSGNSYTFEKAGIVNFLLISTKGELYISEKNIEPTFTVVIEP